MMHVKKLEQIIVSSIPHFDFPATSAVCVGCPTWYRSRERLFALSPINANPKSALLTGLSVLYRTADPIHFMQSLGYSETDRINVKEISQRVAKIIEIHIQTHIDTPSA